MHNFFFEFINKISFEENIDQKFFLCELQLSTLSMSCMQICIQKCIPTCIAQNLLLSLCQKECQQTCNRTSKTSPILSYQPENVQPNQMMNYILECMQNCMSICQHANNLCISNCQQSCLKTCQQQQHPFSPGISNSLVIKTVPVFVSLPASRQSLQTTNHFRLAVNICARTHAWDHASIETGSNHFVIVAVNKLVDKRACKLQPYRIRLPRHLRPQQLPFIHMPL